MNEKLREAWADRMATARHEAGHVVAAWAFSAARGITGAATIDPSLRWKGCSFTGGYRSVCATPMPQDSPLVMSRFEAEAAPIVVLLAGGIAERMPFGPLPPSERSMPPTGAEVWTMPPAPAARQESWARLPAEEREQLEAAASGATGTGPDLEAVRRRVAELVGDGTGAPAAEAGRVDALLRFLAVETRVILRQRGFLLEGVASWLLLKGTLSAAEIVDVLEEREQR